MPPARPASRFSAPRRPINLLPSAISGSPVKSGDSFSQQSIEASEFIRAFT
jgi:hypothetical protein